MTGILGIIFGKLLLSMSATMLTIQNQSIKYINIYLYVCLSCVQKIKLPGDHKTIFGDSLDIL